MTGYYAESCITHCHHLCYCHVRVQPWTFGLITQEVRELEKPLRETTANQEILDNFIRLVFLGT